MFSASCHYALLAMFYIGRNSRQGRNVELADIAARQDIPKHFLSKILQQLVRHKLLVSTKGPHGVFRLSKPCQQIKLIDVVRAIDGEEIFSRCGIGLRSCNPAEPCPIHEEYHQTRRNVHQLFKSKSLKILADEAINGRSFIKYEPAGSE